MRASERAAASEDAPPLPKENGTEFLARRPAGYTCGPSG